MKYSYFDIIKSAIEGGEKIELTIGHSVNKYNFARWVSMISPTYANIANEILNTTSDALTIESVYEFVHSLPNVSINSFKYIKKTKQKEDLD